jgi:hypothetical protein
MSPNADRIAGSLMIAAVFVAVLGTLWIAGS